ncbi:hypothetical protein Dcar01_02107 [Deinococcus carri]|uniref:VWFA domain-containing protein n=1 Tax=Deinococcus carri TaxID=1211323 RepID=A0ABP9W7P5_9DEIO
MRPAAALFLTALLASGPLVRAQSGPVSSSATPSSAAPGVTLRRAPATPPAPPPQAGAGCVLPTGPLPTGTRTVFILDTSGSMRGIGDGQADIFGRVKAAMNAYVRTGRPGRVELVTFDSGPRLRRSYTFPADAARWNADLAALRADGRNTYLYRSVAEALAPLKATPGDVTTVFLLTDGIDNDPDAGHTAQRALAAFGSRGPLDTLHYVALGTQIPQEARAALAASRYAQGLTLPVGQAPRLADYGTPLATVTDPARVPAPFPDGTPLTLAAGEGVRLADGQAQGGLARLTVTGRLPVGTPALLCAPPTTPGGLPRRVLLRLAVGPEPRLTWLNPGADRTLRPGEAVTLRYRLDADTPPRGLRLPAGLTGELLRLPGGREVAVRVQNAGLPDGTGVRPELLLGEGGVLPLAAITAGNGAAMPAGTAAPTPPARPAPAQPAPLPTPPSGPAARLPALLGAVLVLALLALGGLAWGRRRRPARPAMPPAPPPPNVEGLQYSEARTLALVGAGGEVTAVPVPLGGPFDLGQVARVPHLSGLRLQQDQGGLRVLRVPADLEVSQGARLLREDEVVRPGSLLGVAVARPARAPLAPLGTLVGLGLPLRLRVDGVTLHLLGPYGEHALLLRPGITDLGEAFGAPALHGLKLTPSGPHLLLAALPAGVRLRRGDDGAELRPGTYLPPEAQLELPALEG